jgi:hypothetical protein
MPAKQGRDSSNSVMKEGENYIHKYLQQQQQINE